MSFRCGRVPGSTFVSYTAVTEKHKLEALKDVYKVRLPNVWKKS